MKRLLVVLAVPVALIAVFSTFGVQSGCGLPIRIDLPNQTFAFSLNASDLVSAVEEELNVNLQGLDTIPAHININESFEIPLPPQKVDLSDNADLKKYIEAGAVQSVTVKFVDYTVEQNTLNFDLPAVDMYMDNHSADIITASSKKIAVTQPIAAGFTGTDNVSFTTGGRQTLSDFLLSLKFTFLGLVDVHVDTSKTRTIPKGLLNGKLTVGLYFTVEPL